MAPLIDTRQKQLEVAARSSIPFETLKSWAMGKSLPDVDRFVEIALAAGMDPGAILNEAIGVKSPLVAGAAEPSSLADTEDLVHIPYLDVVVSAGVGRINDIVRQLDKLPWPRAVIAAMGNPRKIQCMRATGDSMEPGIKSGALVFMERTEDRVQPRRRHRLPDIYVVIVGDDARVKRVDQPMLSHRMLISDNPEYSPELLPAGRVKIVGRVVGWLNQPY